MKKSVACATAASAAGVITLLGTSPATAQQAAEESTGLQEVVVTARYREESLQQTPIAITAITAQVHQRAAELLRIEWRGGGRDARNGSGPAGGNTSRAWTF